MFEMSLLLKIFQKTLSIAALLHVSLASDELSFAGNSDASFPNKNDLDTRNTSFPDHMDPSRRVINVDEGIFALPLMPHHYLLDRNEIDAKSYEDKVMESSPPRRRHRLLEETYDKQEDAKINDQNPIIGSLYQGYGTHYVDLWVGTPNPQRQTLIIDTGSSVTAFPCTPCENCGKGYHVGEFYNVWDSKTFQRMDCDNCTFGSCKNVQRRMLRRGLREICHIGMSYQEGSMWTAYECSDMVYFGGKHNERHRKLINSNHVHKDNNNRRISTPLDTSKDKSTFEEEVQTAKNRQHSNTTHIASDYTFKYNFACQSKITGLFKTQLADGIMGMEKSTSSFWSQMYRQGAIHERMFALCFSHSQRASRYGSGAGVMTMGGADKRLHSTPMIYAEDMRKWGWFTVYVEAIYLKKSDQMDKSNRTDDTFDYSVIYYNTGDNIKKLDVSAADYNEDDIIIDSGTTDSYLPKAMKPAFKKAWTEVVGSQFQNFIPAASGEILKSFPTILIQLRGATNVKDEEIYDGNGKYLEGLARQVDENKPQDVLLEISPSHYVQYSSKSKGFEIRFHMTEAYGGVIGANFMNDYNILFDIERQRLGFAKSNCDYEELKDMDSS